MNDPYQALATTEPYKTLAEWFEGYDDRLRAREVLSPPWLDQVTYAFQINADLAAVEKALYAACNLLSPVDLVADGEATGGTITYGPIRPVSDYLPRWGAEQFDKYLELPETITGDNRTVEKLGAVVYLGLRRLDDRRVKVRVIGLNRKQLGVISALLARLEEDYPGIHDQLKHAVRELAKPLTPTTRDATTPESGEHDRDYDRAHHLQELNARAEALLARAEDSPARVNQITSVASHVDEGAPMARSSFTVYDPPRIIVEHLRRRLGGPSWWDGECFYTFSVGAAAGGIEITAVIGHRDASGLHIFPETTRGLRQALLRVYQLERGWRIEVDPSPATFPPPIQEALDWLRGKYNPSTAADTQRLGTTGVSGRLVQRYVVLKKFNAGRDYTPGEIINPFENTGNWRNLPKLIDQGYLMPFDLIRVQVTSAGPAGLPDADLVAANGDTEPTPQKPILSSAVAATLDYYNEMLKDGRMPTDDEAAGKLNVSVDTVARHKKKLRALDLLPHSPRSKLASDNR